MESQECAIREALSKQPSPDKSPKFLEPAAPPLRKRKSGKASAVIRGDLG